LSIQRQRLTPKPR